MSTPDWFAETKRQALAARKDVRAKRVHSDEIELVSELTESLVHVLIEFSKLCLERDEARKHLERREAESAALNERYVQMEADLKAAQAENVELRAWKDNEENW